MIRQWRSESPVHTTMMHLGLEDKGGLLHVIADELTMYELLSFGT